MPVTLWAVKRLARILGLIGGIGAVLWAMRDRLVSVAISREPQPPAFRVPDRPPSTRAPTPAPTRVEVTEIAGIGPVYATRLGAAGINTVSELARADAEAVAEAAQVPRSRAETWIASASEKA